MSRDQDWNTTPLRDVSQLREYFESGSKGELAKLGIGTEHEKFGYDRRTGKSVEFDGERGIGALLEQLAERFDWESHLDGGHLMALTRDNAAVTLEPGGQLELSGAVFETIHGIRDELYKHLREVAEVSDELELDWTFFGVQPWGSTSNAPWMPKPRYEIMKKYLPTRGKLAHWMMLMTCSIQANYDYRDEDDAMEMLRIASLLGPLITALFANSPYREGADAKVVSTRMRIWQETDPDRCGTPDFFLDPTANFDDYIDYIIDVPMFFIKRDGAYLSMAGRSFREFMETGFNKFEPTLGDFELHLSTAFPDVRLKKFIEVRTADGNLPDRILALSALWKGIFYDDHARRRAENLFSIFEGRELDALALICRQEGLDGVWRGQSIRLLATKLIEIAGDGLDSQSSSEESERDYLDCLLRRGRAYATAELLRDDWNELKGDRTDLIDRYSLRRYLAHHAAVTAHG